MNTRDLKEWLLLGPLPKNGAHPWRIYICTPGNPLPKNPRGHVCLTPVGSGNLNTEMVYENRFWQLRVRGNQGRNDDAMENAQVECEDAATALDRYILGYDWPAYIGGTKVQFGTRTGAGPTPLGSGGQDGRSDYCATYLFDVATGL